MLILVCSIFILFVMKSLSRTIIQKPKSLPMLAVEVLA